MCLHILFSGASPPCFWGRAVGSRYPRHLGWASTIPPSLVRHCKSTTPNLIEEILFGF
jgi:hypothetical protein